MSSSHHPHRRHHHHHHNLANLDSVVVTIITTTILLIIMMSTVRWTWTLAGLVWWLLAPSSTELLGKALSSPLLADSLVDKFSQHKSVFLPKDLWLCRFPTRNQSIFSPHEKGSWNFSKLLHHRQFWFSQISSLMRKITSGHCKCGISSGTNWNFFFSGGSGQIMIIIIRWFWAGQQLPLYLYLYLYLYL